MNLRIAPQINNFLVCKLLFFEGFWVLFGCFMSLFGRFSMIFAYAKCPGPEVTFYTGVPKKEDESITPLFIGGF
jgi:hypothetical protein